MGDTGSGWPERGEEVVLNATRAGFALACLVAANVLPAQSPPPSAPVEGLYASDTRETASSLVLDEDGRFWWGFTMGALDTFALGRWTRDPDGTILLNSDPPVTAPTFTLRNATRNDEADLIVRLACDSGQAYQFLDIEVEYADGERVRDHFPALEYRLVPEPGRRVAAVTLGSAPFDFRSERFPVTQDQANVLTFGFNPNDLGITDFRNQRVRLGSGELSLSWRGVDLHYVRERALTAADRTDAAQLDALLAARSTRAAPAAPVAPGAVDVTLGEPVERVLERTSIQFTSDQSSGLRTAAPVDLRMRLGERLFDAGRIGGMDDLTLSITYGPRSETVTGVFFNYQDGLLDLAQALERARAFRAWLEQGGFARSTSYEGNAMPDFRVVTFDNSDGATASDWDSASRMLADEGQAIKMMHLYSMGGGDYSANAQLFNVRRNERETCAHSEWSGTPGREWRLYLSLSLRSDLQLQEYEPPPDEGASPDTPD